MVSFLLSMNVVHTCFGQVPFQEIPNRLFVDPVFQDRAPRTKSCLAGEHTFIDYKEKQHITLLEDVSNGQLIEQSNRQCPGDLVDQEVNLKCRNGKIKTHRTKRPKIKGDYIFICSAMPKCIKIATNASNNTAAEKAAICIEQSGTW